MWKVIFFIGILSLCSSEDEPECIVFDPLDSSTFDSWTDCGADYKKFELKEYSQLPSLEPFDPEARFVMAASGPGDFCIVNANFAKYPRFPHSEMRSFVNLNTDSDPYRMNLVVLDHNMDEFIILPILNLESMMDFLMDRFNIIKFKVCRRFLKENFN